MPQDQMDTLSAVSHQLPEIAKQLRIANELKALEMKITFISEGYYDVDKKVNTIMRDQND